MREGKREGSKRGNKEGGDRGMKEEGKKAKKLKCEGLESTCALF